jgi:hypothetical protein
MSKLLHLGVNKGTIREEHDFYTTDPNSIKSLLDNYHIEGNSFYEPCCGDGAISKVLKERYPNANHFASDLIDRGYGETGVDFLDYNNKYGNTRSDWIITNPPFKLSLEFTLKALEQTNKGVAMFLRLQWVEGVRRYDSLFKDNNPHKILVFIKRQKSYKSGIVSEGGSTMCFAWFIWNHTVSYDDTIIKWIW